jgi:hypothetical protein
LAQLGKYIRHAGTFLCKNSELQSKINFYLGDIAVATKQGQDSTFAFHTGQIKDIPIPKNVLIKYGPINYFSSCLYVDEFRLHIVDLKISDICDEANIN